MKSLIRRTVMLFAALMLALAAGLPAAQAANHHASCVGIIVSAEAPAGDFDVNAFKAFAGDAPFGQFVTIGARLHEGSYQACFP